jgi:nucleoside-diphosphate-sugar epimerase
VNLLLTGGTGFIGFNLAKNILTQNNRLTLVSRKSLQTSAQINKLSKLGAKVVDCKNPDYLSQLLDETERFDAVIHLAAHYTRKHTASEIRPMMEAATILGTEMLEVAKHQNCRFFYAGSYLEYMSEKARINTLYVESKRAFDQLSKYYEMYESVTATKMIFFDTYGPGDSRDKILNNLISAKLADKEYVIKNPKQLIDLTHISDMVQGIYQTIRNPWVDVVRINSGYFIEISDLQALVSHSLQMKDFSESHIDRLVEKFPALVFSQPNNWTARVGLMEGVLGMINHEKGKT